MVDQQVTSEWLKKADEDFEFAASVIEESPFYAQICFHFHQAAEKYLKSYLIAAELQFKRIHDLPVLLKSCLLKEPGLESIVKDCKLLNRFYIDTRYLVHWPTEYTRQDAFEAKNAAEHIRDVIKNALNPLVSS